MENKPRAAIYTRVSTEEQKKGYSLEAQEKTLRDHATKKSYQVIDLYNDGGYTAKDFNRPEFSRMMEDVEADKIDIILVWKVDRLSRSISDVTTLIDKVLTPNNKSIELAAIDMNSSDSVGRMFISLLGVFAAYERTTIIDRVNSGMSERAKQGQYNGGLVLGYDSEEGELIINKKEADIVRDIFELRAAHYGYKAIAIELNNKGYRTKKGNHFQINSIKTILNSPIYIGKIQWGKYQDYANKGRKGKSDPIVSEGKHDPIISEELWEQVQTVNKEHNDKHGGTSRSKNSILLLSGIIRCPQCGSGTVFSKVKKQKGGYYYYYMCQRSHNGGKSLCSSNLINKDNIEPKVLELLKQILQLDKQLIDDVLLNINETNNSKKFSEDSIDAKSNHLKKLYDKRNKLDEDYFLEVLDAKTYSRLLKKVDEEIDDLNNTIEELNKAEEKKNKIELTHNEIAKAFHQIDELFKSADENEKKQLLRLIFDEIQVTQDRKDIASVKVSLLEEGDLPLSEMRGTVSQIDERCIEFL